MLDNSQDQQSQLMKMHLDLFDLEMQEILRQYNPIFQKDNQFNTEINRGIYNQEIVGHIQMGLVNIQ